MPRAEVEAWEAAEAAPRDAEGHVSFAVFRAEYERRLAERQARLLRDADASARAMDGWSRVSTRDEWLAMVRRAAEDLEDGSFLVDRLGAERHLDPQMMAMLLVLRRGLIDEHGAAGAAELMLVDCAVISYYHVLRINGWIGNFAALTEAGFFQKEGPSATCRDRHDRGGHRIDGLRVEDHVRRIGEQLLPLLDRCNRMLIRNLKALRALRDGQAPSVSIGAAGQVNVATNQTNAVRGAGASEPGS
jgi:hypothetical protein